MRLLLSVNTFGNFKQQSINIHAIILVNSVGAFYSGVCSTLCRVTLIVGRSAIGVENEVRRNTVHLTLHSGCWYT